MGKSLYDALGINPGASPDQVRSAYRKLVLRHHPDHSRSQHSKEIFMRVTEAYEVLGDSDRRTEYDRTLQQEGMTREETRRKIQEGPDAPAASPPRPKAALKEEVAKLTVLYRQGKHSAAEDLARQILEIDGRQPVAYAVLGDLARARGRMAEASKMYAYAAQMDPSHPEYEQRYLETLSEVDRISAPGQRFAVAPVLIAGGAVCVCGIYLVLSKEQPLMPGISLISSFTLGLVVMALISGISLGASFGLGGIIDRFSATAFDTFGRMSPAIALGLVSLVNFWVAALFYLIVSASQRSFQYSANRLVVSTAATLVFFGICATLSASLNSFQTVLWGGNLIYFGSLVGWAVSDAFRK